jgi:DNA modification methylase
MKPYYEEAGIVIYNADWQSCHLHQGGPFDLLLTDPPYGIGEARGKNKTRGGKFGGKGGSGHFIPSKDYGVDEWDDAPPNDSDVCWMQSLAKYQIIFGGNYFGLPPAKCWLVWDKINGANDFADCELAWTNLDKAVRQFRYMWNGMLKEQPEERFHPTQKPLALMKWCISQAPKTVQTVVDPYMGSGTTLVAAKAVGLSAVGCDTEERYCEIAANRLRQSVLNFEGVA